MPVWSRFLMAHLFEPQEFAARLLAVRREMARRDLPLVLLSSPDNIFYLTGLDHWGYFAPHLLIVPAEGGLVLVTRAMEQVTIAAQVANARFAGHADSETVADVVVRELQAGRLPDRIGLELWSSGLPAGLAHALQLGLGNVRWSDVTGLVDDIRLVKSPAEQVYLRAAAKVTDAATDAGIAAIRPGASEAEVAAACLRVMTEQGTYPGFGPFIRSTDRLGEEHTSWTGRRLDDGDAVFFELSGCVARYHAPLGRLVHVGRVPSGTCDMAAITQDAFDAVVGTLKDGVLARDVYAAWQAVVDRAGLAHYRRHHCGYMVGIGMPPSWTGGNKVLGLRHDSEVVIRTGMSFHVLSWLMGTERGDYFISNTVLLGDDGPEVLTRTPTDVTIR
ncbi:MAG TPA: Xaa-Pro peptidase family protein [Geminicoccus sp.]|jgi:Xaa-Pro dipeptidase|uniref:M24 family metallopeptidase n=1 Tax=Geminicoccus sp. TaxID=2024832 RepID=UPI002E36A147|nr:Xaa-Pro peptidase family protein [Geminicoccus sp.]HEX2527981.1 Xaa-Pro peptidase family protein [Geminicoccus sp.]